MRVFQTSINLPEEIAERRWSLRSSVTFVFDSLMLGALTCIIFYLSLIATSIPTLSHDRAAIKRAVDILDSKGFTREVFLLKRVVSFRSTDNWLNSLNKKTNAYASTNFPFEVVTLYPDFYSKTVDDTERAMVLLHEAQHLQGKSEPESYEFVWRNRKKLGWTSLTHGHTPTYISVAEQTRDLVPQLFSCGKRTRGD